MRRFGRDRAAGVMARVTPRSESESRAASPTIRSSDHLPAAAAAAVATVPCQ